MRTYIVKTDTATEAVEADGFTMIGLNSAIFYRGAAADMIDTAMFSHIHSIKEKAFEVG